MVTGRWALPRLVQATDPVTELREVKRYYREGGIESNKANVGNTMNNTPKSLWPTLSAICLVAAGLVIFGCS